LFKKVTDKTYSEYLSGLRIDYACRLMELTGMSLEQIAYKCGFNDYYYFCKVFKKITGKPPLKYRKEKMSEHKS
jgi:two-component system response regulator YesN